MISTNTTLPGDTTVVTDVDEKDPEIRLQAPRYSIKHSDIEASQAIGLFAMRVLLQLQPLLEFSLNSATQTKVP